MLDREKHKEEHRSHKTGRKERLKPQKYLGLLCSSLCLLWSKKFPLLICQLSCRTILRSPDFRIATSAPPASCAARQWLKRCVPPCRAKSSSPDRIASMAKGCTSRLRSSPPDWRKSACSSR